jgi:hypothetical protein
MIAIQVARIIADMMIFLNMTDEEYLNPDDAVEMMENLGARIDEFEKGFLRELVDAFPIIAEEYSEEAKALVIDIPYSFYLEEELAEGNPARLAELEAIRDARG